MVLGGKLAVKGKQNYGKIDAHVKYTEKNISKVLISG